MRRPLAEWTTDDVRALLTEQVREDSRLDYKEDFPRNRLERDPAKSSLEALDRKDLVADVTAFANAAGGLLIYGVSEERDSAGVSTGLPESAAGLLCVSPIDKVEMRLTSLVRDNTDPPLHGVLVRGFDGFSKGPIFVVEVARSWAAPHAVKDNGRFYRRHGTMNAPMDASSLRRAFLQSHDLLNEIRRFHLDRLAVIGRDEQPMPLMEGGRIVVHVVPFASLDGQVSVDLQQLDRSRVRPLTSGELDGYGLEGYFRYAYRDDAQGRQKAVSYALVFGTGAIEAVDTFVLAGSGSGKPGIRTRGIEQAIRSALESYLGLYARVGVVPPFALTITLAGVRGYTLVTSDLDVTAPVRPVAKDTLHLPDLILTDPAEDLGRALRPAFDALSRSVGLPMSRSYDSAGNWQR